MKLTTEQIAVIRLDKQVHKATHEQLVQLVQNITGFPINLENEPTTRKECIEEIRRLVLEARQEIGWFEGDIPDDVVKAAKALGSGLATAIKQAREDEIANAEAQTS
jgi:hypothetical protein